MQELGLPVMQLTAFGIIAVAFVLAWILDKRYDMCTSFQFIFPESEVSKSAIIETRKLNVKSCVRLWWAGAIIQVLMVSVGGYLIFSLYSAISFLVVSGFYRFITGIFYLRPNVDTLTTFERSLEIKSAIMPITEMFLKQEIDRCITENLLRKEDYDHYCNIYAKGLIQ